MRFSEVDFQAVEGEEEINFSLTVMGGTPVDLKLRITPYTFEEYRNQIGIRLPDTIADRAAGLDRAEGE